MNDNIFLKVRVGSANASEEFAKLKKRIDSTDRSVNKIDKNFAKLQNQNKKNSNQFANMNKDLNRMNQSLNGLNKGLGSLGKLLNINTASIYLLSNRLAVSITSAMDMTETVNLFSVSLGQNAVSASKYVDEISRAFALDPTNVQNAVGTYALLARSMGISGDNAETLATNTHKLAVDLASLTNVPINQVMSDLRSGLLGQSETVYKYGIDVTEASLKQEALNQGITKSVRNMSQGEKMALRYSTMLRQTSLSHGDFAKTIDESANQFRIFQDSLTTFTRHLGTIFLPLLGKVLPYMNAILHVMTNIVKTIATLVGYEIPEPKNTENAFSGVADGADDASDAVDGVTKSLKNMNDFSLGIDELNTINPDTSNSGASGVDGGSSIFDLDLSGYDNMMDKVSAVNQELVTNIENSIQKIMDFLSPLSEISFTNLKNSLADLLTPLSVIGGFVGEGLQFFFNEVLVPLGEWAIESALPKVLDVIGKVIKIVGEIIEANKPVYSALWNDILKPMGDWTGKILLGALDVLADVLDVIAYLIDKYPEPIALLSSVLAGLAIAIGLVNVALKLKAVILPIVTGLTSAFGAVMAFVTSPIGIVITIIGALIAVIYLLVKNWDTVKEVATNTWTKIKETWNKCVEWFKKTVQEPLAKTFTNIKDSIGESFQNAVKAVEKVWVSVSEWFTKYVSTPISTVFTNVSNAIKNAFTTAFNFVTQTIPNWLNQHVFVWFTASKWISIMSGIKTAFNTIFKNAINGAIEMFNKFINWVNQKMRFSWNAIVIAGKTIVPAGSVQLVNIPNIPMLAQGGMLERGQIFEAGEFGKAEMVGNYQGRTTVMPLENTSFVGAIYDAVYKAMTDTQENGGTVVNAILELDGETIYKNQQKVKVSRGYDLGLGVFSR